MRSLAFAALLLAVLSTSMFGQSKPNAEIQRQLRSLQASEHITLTFDAASGMSKLMAVSPNFSDADAAKAGVIAMNFATGFFFHGQEIKTAQDPILLTFWVMSKKPRFGERHALVLNVGGVMTAAGDARYVARARDGMEYLNFDLSREVLAKIASGQVTGAKLGDADITFTKQHIKLIGDLLNLSDPNFRQ